MSTKAFSRIITGTMSWGSWGKQLSIKAMTELIEYCLELGITSFDHADIYGGYTTESEFGKALEEGRFVRENIQLISKCGIQYVTEARNNSVKHYNYDKNYIIWSVDESLKKLRTDYLDLLLLHRPSPLMHPDSIEEAVNSLKEQGKIKAFGVSNFTNPQMELIGSKTRIEVNQIEFSITQHQAMNDGNLDYMMAHDILPMAWSPLGEVFKKDNEQTRRIHRQLGELLEKYQSSEDELLLAWIMKHPACIHPVIGTTNKERLGQAIKAISLDLELEDWFKILITSQGHKVP